MPATYTCTAKGPGWTSYLVPADEEPGGHAGYATSDRSGPHTRQQNEPIWRDLVASARCSTVGGSIATCRLAATGFPLAAITVSGR